MTRSRELILWISALLLGIETVREALTNEQESGLHASRTAAPIPSVVLLSADSLGRLSADVEEGDVFRLARQPGPAQLDTRPSAQQGQAGIPSAAIVSPRIPLTLKAIVGGPPWQGVVEGFPGRESAVFLRTGDKVDRFTVRSVGRDTVVIQSPDSLYRLTIQG